MVQYSIVHSRKRRLALGAFAALAAVPAAAQKPNAAFLPQGLRLSSAFWGAKMAEAGRFKQVFDADTAHRGLELVPTPMETPAYRRTFKRLLAQPEKTDRYDGLIVKYARLYRLDPRFLKSIMAAESEFDARAVSPAGARGLMQVMPATSEEMGIPAGRLDDPESGIKAGAAYLRRLFKAACRLFRLPDSRCAGAPQWLMQRVIAAYHAGPRFLTRSACFPSTRSYVRKVVLFYRSRVSDLRGAPR